jgi:hypothetical protein
MGEWRTTSFWWNRLHRDERGSVSLETILIIGAIALPLLVFIIKYGWPQIRHLFYRGAEELGQEAERVKGNQ